MLSSWGTNDIGLGDTGRALLMYSLAGREQMSSFGCLKSQMQVSSESQFRLACGQSGIKQTLTYTHGRRHVMLKDNEVHIRAKRIRMCEMILRVP